MSKAVESIQKRVSGIEEATIEAIVERLEKWGQSPDKPYQDCVDALRLWAKGFSALGIKWVDLHDENVLAKGRAYILADLGASSAVPFDPPELEV